MKVNNKNTILSDEDYEEHEKGHEHAEDFHGQPPIVTDVVQILQKFTLRLVDVHDDVFDVFVDANGHLALFVDHGGELLENAAEFGDGALDVLHGVGARGGVVLVLVLVDGDLIWLKDIGFMWPKFPCCSPCCCSLLRAPTFMKLPVVAAALTLANRPVPP